MTEDRAALVGFDYCPDIRIAVTDGKGGVNFTLNGKGAPAGISLYHESYVASLKAELAAALAMQPPGDGEQLADDLAGLKEDAEKWRRSGFLLNVNGIDELHTSRNALVAQLAAKDLEIEKWQSLASQIRTDWMPANAKLAERAEAAMGLLRRCHSFLEDMHTQPVDWTIAESQPLHLAIEAIMEAERLELGRKAWVDVPDAADWVRDIRGTNEDETP